MSYRIIYTADQQMRGSTVSFSRRFLFTAVSFVLFLLYVHFFWEEGALVLRSLRLRGSWNDVASAADILSKELRGGAGISEALLTFCNSIMEVWQV